MEGEVYEYDKKNNFTILEKYDKNQNFVSGTVYKYSNKNKLEEREIYDSKQELIEKTIFKYDGSGLLSEAIIMDAQGVAKRTLKYDYSFKKIKNKKTAKKNK